MNFGAMSVLRSVNAVSATPAVNSNRDIIYRPYTSQESLGLCFTKRICPPCDKCARYHERK